MTLSMNDEHYGLREMSTAELIEANGGDAGIPKVLRAIGGWGLVFYISDNWDEIKREFQAGWNIDKK